MMGLFRPFCYLTVALVAVLAYFHMECVQKEGKDGNLSYQQVFESEKTNCEDVELFFRNKGDIITADISFLYMQLPCVVKKLLSFFGLGGSANICDPILSTDTKALKQCIQDQGDDSLKVHNVTMFDARKVGPIEFYTSGFTLLTLDEESVTTDWTTTLAEDENADIVNFHQQMNPHLEKLYPNVKKIHWSHNIVRGGDGKSQPKAVSQPHHDFHQNDLLRFEYHKRRPIYSSFFGTSWLPLNEAHIMNGELDTEDSKVGVILGVWKPIAPTTEVCDYPLAVMDSSTYDSEHQVQAELAINFGLFTLNLLNAGIAYSPEQKWYYYSFQNTKEVLVFHQYSKEKFLVNPHTSFENKNCPTDLTSRKSVDLRVALFF